MGPPRISVLALAVVILLASQFAFARGTCTPAAPVMLNVPPLADLPPNPVKGQVLGNPDGYTFEVPDALVCTYDMVFTEYYSFMSMPASTGFSGEWVFHYGVRMPVYFTGLRGVGFGMIAQDRDGGAFMDVTTGVTTLRGPLHPGLPSWGMRGRLFFFATGPIDPGVIAARTIASLQVSGATGNHSIVLGNTVIGPPMKPTCSVSTPSLALRLGAIAAKDFKGVGSSAGAVTESIVLQCAGGTGANVDVWVTLSDQTTGDNRSDQLSLTPDSTAKGVALQLLYAGNPVRFGPDDSSIGAPNQWPAGSTDNGSFTISLTARYVQILPIIQGGTANGVATFTLSYR